MTTGGDRHRGLLEAYRQAKAPTDADRDRVWRSIERGDTEARRQGMIVAVVIAAAGIAALWWAIGWLDRSAASPRSTTSRDQAIFEQERAPTYRRIEAPNVRPVEQRRALEPSVTQNSAAAPMTPERPPAVDVPRRGRAPAPQRPSASAPRTDSLAVEMERLRQAERRIDAGEPDAALAVLDAHARDFPDSPLALERKALRIIALCRKGKHPQGRGEAAALRKAAPSSPYLERIEAACKEP